MLTTIQARPSKRDYLNFLLLAYAFVLPISRAALSLLTALLVLFWLFDSDLKKRAKEIFKNRVIQALALFLIYMTLSLFWSSDIEQGLNYLRRYWYLLPVIVFVSYVKKEQTTNIISAFLAGMFVSEIFSYGIFFEIFAWRNVSPSNPTPFINHLQYSMFLAFTSLLLFNRFFFQNDYKLKFFYFLYFLVVTSNLFINGGRTGQVAFLLTIILVGFLNIKNKLIAFFTMFTLVTILFLSAYHLSPVFEKRFNQAKQEVQLLYTDSDEKYHQSFGQRLGAWMVAYEMFKDNPVFGVGHGASMAEFDEKINTDMPEFKVVSKIVHFHNNYVHYLVEGGIVGLSIYLSLFFMIYKLKIPNKEIKNASYIFLSIFLISSMVEHMFIAQAPLALFALFVGIFMTYSKKNLGTNS